MILKGFSAIQQRKKELELSFILAPNLPAEIRTDSHRLQQILRNLLTNAIKFTEKGFVKFIIDAGSETWEGFK